MSRFTYLLINYELFKQGYGGEIKLRMMPGRDMQYAQNKICMQLWLKTLKGTYSWDVQALGR
jgi:hypothetical protein